MKIEMGESIMKSWLSHIKECQIVEMNWKPSPKWKMKHLSELDNILKHTIHLFGKVFKTGTDSKRFLRQAECDAIGINFDDDKRNIHAVDVAFHEGGLNYNGNTVEKVVEKSIRTAMCIYTYLDSDDADIYFASPISSPKIGKGVFDALNQLQIIMDDLGYHFRFHFITNAEFKDEIIDPVTGVSGDVANSNELWLRAYQMYNLFNNNIAKPRKITAKTPSSSIRIGELAKHIFKTLIESGRLSDAEINDLLDEGKSKQIFNVRFPILVKESDTYPLARYYSKKSYMITYKGVNYLLTNYWIEHLSRSNLETWYKKF